MSPCPWFDCRPVAYLHHHKDQVQVAVSRSGIIDATADGTDSLDKVAISKRRMGYYEIGTRLQSALLVYRLRQLFQVGRDEFYQFRECI